MASTWLYLVRHGEVREGAEGRFVGHTDPPLSETGLEQARRVGRALAELPIEAVYSSDLLRSRQSAAEVARPLGLEPVAVPALREMAMGRWEGLTLQEIAARDPDLLTAWLARLDTFVFPGGEGLLQLRARVLPALREILDRHAGRRVVVVAHGGPNRVILAEALGLPLAHLLRLGQEYGGLSLIEYRADTAIVHRLNQPPGADHAG